MSILRPNLEVLNSKIVQQKFWSKVLKGSADECWIWKGSITNYGYGVFHIKGKPIIASRAAWYITQGPFDTNLFLCHKCDNPICVNPDHLFLGTAADNHRDMRKKGRSGRQNMINGVYQKVTNDALSSWEKAQDGRDKAAEAFWAKVNKEHDSGCWLWLGRSMPNGYGRFTLNYKNILAHRFAWEITNGPIPDRLYICHKCDVRMCVNPDHLFLGTAADNNNDTRSKGRAYILNTSKLNYEKVNEIRELHKQGYSYSKLASKYKVSTSAICDIVRWKTWRSKQ